MNELKSEINSYGDTIYYFKGKKEQGYIVVSSLWNGNDITMFVSHDLKYPKSRIICDDKINNKSIIYHILENYII